MLRFLGGAFGIAVLGAVFTGTGGLRSPHAFSAGFTAVIGVAAALSVLGAVAGMWQPSAGEAALAPVDAKA
jgi:hypothetical protein